MELPQGDRKYAGLGTFAARCLKAFARKAALTVLDGGK